VKAAAVAGRVRYDSGEPAAALGVELLKSFYDTSGQKILQPIGSARTNDLGEYRVFWVSPGHYYLAVTTNQNVGTVLSANGTIVGASSPNEVEHVAQPTVYYPGTVDLKSAVPIQLSSGDDLRAIDVLVPQTQRVLTIRGRVLDSATGQPPRGLNMTLLPRDTSLQRLGLNSDSSGYDSAKGTFEIRDVVPGTYWLQAQAGGIGNNGARLGTTMMLDVARDLEGLVLNLSAGIPVSGRLRVEGQALSASPMPTPRVSLRPTRPYALTSPSVLVTADGSFTLQNVFVGEYAIVVTPMPTGYFLKEARIGQVDVLGRPWVIEETSVRDSLEVVLGSNAGNIEGKVVDSRSQPAAGIQAVLVPDESRFRNELFINAVTDQEGRFALRGVAPGTYRLFAWEYVEANSFFDPEVLRRYEQQGVPVRVREGETAVLEVKIIPTLPK
jgi:5-hydroxyisourate hydrolase-like protein (transthyretin family)